MTLRQARLLARSLVIVAVIGGSQSAPLQARALGLAERVAAQRAIDRAYYAHQEGATKPFDVAVPESVTERKVTAYLRQSAALDRLWRTPVTAEALDREIERIVGSTRFPDRLRELFAALGDDPFLIRECLARPALVDRAFHNAFSYDTTIHAAARAEADALRVALVGGAIEPDAAHPARSVVEVVLESETGARGAADAAEPVDAAEFARRAATAFEARAVRVDEEDGAFVLNVRLGAGPQRLRIASYRVPKRSREDWLNERSGELDAAGVPAVASSAPLPEIGSSCGPGDLWKNGTLADGPDGRENHTVVWTGNRMLLWSGANSARYDPVTDTWSPISTLGIPNFTTQPSALWTGSSMILWGGDTSTGGRYDPASDTWLATSLVGAPSARHGHTAVWTGSRMVIWGGDPVTSSGGRYDPFSDTWEATTLVGAPSSRRGHTAVWTGSRMIVVGGEGAIPGEFADGGSYDPLADTWTPLINPANPPRAYHTAVWTGSKMIVFGGKYAGIGTLSSGQAYDPVTGVWSPISPIGPPARYNHLALLAGSSMLIWGGTGAPPRTGGNYDIAGDTWSAISTTGAPFSGSKGVWTGSLMIVSVGNADARYDPVSDTWTPAKPQLPLDLSNTAPAQWTGNRVFLFRAMYDLVLEAYFRITPGWSYDNYKPVSVWTGEEVIVAPGGRYNPATDTWVYDPQLTAANYGTAVWTGREMLVWGGDSAGAAAYRYDPTSNPVKRPISSAGAPSQRRRHTAVWTGKRMLVWGGTAGDPIFGDGASYDPLADTWTPMSAVGAPTARFDHSAVWTGSKMIVWGGRYNAQATGGVYDPATDLWAGVTTIAAPAARFGHGAAWTGSRMIVWGGLNDAQAHSGPGGLYDPLADAWTPVTALDEPPTPREQFSTIWTGDSMVVWGGFQLDSQGQGSSGGRYVPDSDGDGLADGCDLCPHIADPGQPDADGDGRGDACDTCPDVADADADGDGSPACEDCDDADPAVFPGASEFCDGRNNDCRDPAWPEPSPRETDGDGDGFMLCEYDCADDAPTVYPGAPPLCDGLNNNCNSSSWPGPAFNERDNDGDGLTGCQGDCDDIHSTVRPGGAQVCDGANNDCSHPGWPALAGTNEADDDADQADECGGDCDDTNPLVNPYASETCNGLDDDCDARIDEDAGGNEDSDGDTVRYLCDNCPANRNLAQTDTDHDGQGDTCDLDDGTIQIRFDERTVVSWQAEAGFTSWNAYRGSLNVLAATGTYTQPPGSNPLAARACGQPSAETTEPGAAAPGDVVFWLVTGVANGDESGLGEDSSGTPRPNENPCP